MYHQHEMLNRIVTVTRKFQFETSVLTAPIHGTGAAPPLVGYWSTARPVVRVRGGAYRPPSRSGVARERSECRQSEHGTAKFQSNLRGLLDIDARWKTVVPEEGLELQRV
jgi:hypothetical protein